jgi:hypothetical protein
MTKLAISPVKLSRIYYLTPCYSQTLFPAKTGSKFTTKFENLLQLWSSSNVAILHSDISPAEGLLVTGKRGLKNAIYKAKHG